MCVCVQKRKLSYKAGVLGGMSKDEEKLVTDEGGLINHKSGGIENKEEEWRALGPVFK